MEKQHVGGHRYRRQYSIMQLVESSTQYVGVHSKTLELIRDAWSLVHEAIL